ncbi:hypothetical protein [Nostoc phage A1]|nr:hypothetical protein [Nostoc phage A1]
MKNDEAVNDHSVELISGCWYSTMVKSAMKNIENSKSTESDSQHSVELISGCWYSAMIDSKFKIEYKLRFYSVTITETKSLRYLFFDVDEQGHVLDTSEIRQYRLKLI